MKFIIPPFERKENPIGVYRIWFNEKWFYIGSSKTIKFRFSKWKVSLMKPKYLKNLNVKKILPQIENVKFEIIHKYKSASWLRRSETKLIRDNWDNPMLLNRCPKGNTNKGMRPYNGYVKLMPKDTRKGIPEYMQPRKIALFDDKWKLVKVFESISSFCRYSKFRSSTVNSILEGKRGQHRVFEIKKVGRDGSFIEPPKFIPKEQIRPIRPGKPFIQMYPSGEFIALHTSLGSAAEKLGCSKQLIQRHLKGRGRCYAPKGFIFKYA